MPKPQRPDAAREIRALEARLLQAKGLQLSTAQRADLAWLEKKDAAFYAEVFARCVPKADYCRMAGRQNKLIDDAARNYDLPVGGATVDLYAAIKALHDLIASNAQRLRRDVEDDREELEKEKLRKQIEGLEWDNDRKQIDLSHARGEAIPKLELRQALSALQAQLRAFGQHLRRSNPTAVDEFNELLDRLAEETETGKLAFD